MNICEIQIKAPVDSRPQNSTTEVTLIDIKCFAQMAHKPVQQSRQQALKAYCPNIYTVPGVQSSQANNFNEVINSKELLR